MRGVCLWCVAVWGALVCVCEVCVCVSLSLCLCASISIYLARARALSLSLSPSLVHARRFDVSGRARLKAGLLLATEGRARGHLALVPAHVGNLHPRLLDHSMLLDLLRRHLKVLPGHRATTTAEGGGCGGDGARGQGGEGETGEREKRGACVRVRGGC